MISFTPEDIRSFGSEEFTESIFLKGCSIDGERDGNRMGQDRENEVRAAVILLQNLPGLLS